MDTTINKTKATSAAKALLVWKLIRLDYKINQLGKSIKIEIDATRPSIFESKK